MRRLLFLSLAIVLILLASCENSAPNASPASNAGISTSAPSVSAPAEEVTPSGEPTSAEPENPGGEIIEPETATLTETKEYRTGDVLKGRLNLSFPQIAAETPSANDKKFNDAQQKELLRAAKEFEDLLEANDGAQTWSYETECDRTYSKNGVVSFLTVYNIFSGGVHNTTVLKADTFDRTSGEFLGLGDLFTVGSEEFLPVLFDEIIEQMERSPGDYFSNYAALARETFSPASFYLSGGALVLFYQEYDVAPYVSGVREFEISFDSLKDIMAPRFRDES